MTRKYNSDYDYVETQTETSMMKKVVIGAIGTIVTYYVTAWATRLLEEKPLKARIRDGKQRAVDLKDSAMMRAESAKARARVKAEEAKSKAARLYDGGESMYAADNMLDTYETKTTVVKSDRGPE